MNEDSRLILSARRPGGEDDHEPEVAAAIAASARDSALADWAERQVAVDRKIATALRTVQPPAGLRDRIIAGARVSRPARAGGSGSWFERRVFGFLRNSELVAIAAVIALLAVALAYNYFTQTIDERPWQTFAVAKAAEIESGTVFIEHEDALFETTVGWLRERACPAPEVLPAGLQGLGIFGCSSVKWNGKPMGIVCFKLGDDKEVHLVSIDARHIPVPLTGVPAWSEISGYTAAQWEDKGTAYMLIGRVPRAVMEPLVAEKIAAIMRNFIHFL